MFGVLKQLTHVHAWLCGSQAAQRKVLDVLNSVGLSDALLRVIDRRQRLDRWITYGGMVRATCFTHSFRWTDADKPLIEYFENYEGIALLIAVRGCG